MTIIMGGRGGVSHYEQRNTHILITYAHEVDNRVKHCLG